MVSSLRLVYLCFTSARLQLEAFGPSTGVVAPASSFFGASIRAMTTDNNVCQADIGKEQLTKEASSIPSEGEEQSWRKLLEVSSAKSRKIRGSNFVQLATVDHRTNEPRCRCVVFRGFQKLPDGHFLSNAVDNMSCIMKMVTDNRSEKVEQVLAHPSQAAELLWWFPKTSEQYRIRGRLLFVGGGMYDHDGDRDLLVARKEQWGNLSDAARESFLAKEKPGVSYSGESRIPEGGRDQDGNVLPPPDTFLLMLLIPKHCDYLRLTNMYRQKDKQSANGDWSSLRLNP